MKNTKQTYLFAGMITFIAGIGMLSTAMAAYATGTHTPTPTPSPAPVYTPYPVYAPVANSNVNTNSNSNENNVYVPNYAPPVPYYAPPVPPIHYAQAPVYQPQYQTGLYSDSTYYYDYPAPGVPNTGFGGLAGMNLVILAISGLFMAAGGAYLFRRSAVVPA